MGRYVDDVLSDLMKYKPLFDRNSIESWAGTHFRALISPTTIVTRINIIIAQLRTSSFVKVVNILPDLKAGIKLQDPTPIQSELIRYEVTTSYLKKKAEEEGHTYCKESKPNNQVWKVLSEVSFTN